MRLRILHLTMAICVVAALSGCGGARMMVCSDGATGGYTFYEQGRPLLRYNFGAVPVPEGATGPYAVARSDYIHPLHGPSGESLTADYPPDFPHHRGIYWAWPEVAFRGVTHDLHALQGVFARPVAMRRVENGFGSASLVAESVWMWEDAEPIVRELATIRVHRAEGGRRAIDILVRLEALAEGVTIARRGREHYGGMNLRFSLREEQSIVLHTDPPWATISGVAPGGEGPVTVAILQAASNPRYPGDWVQFPNLPWVQPTFPGSGEAFALDPKAPLELRYRFVVGEGVWDEAEMARLATEPWE